MTGAPWPERQCAVIFLKAGTLFAITTRLQSFRSICSTGHFSCGKLLCYSSYTAWRVLPLRLVVNTKMCHNHSRASSKSFFSPCSWRICRMSLWWTWHSSALSCLYFFLAVTTFSPAIHQPCSVSTLVSSPGHLFCQYLTGKYSEYFLLLCFIIIIFFVFIYSIEQLKVW